MKYFLPALLLCIAGLCTRAQDIVLNPKFGNSGIVTKSPNKKSNILYEQANSVIQLPDGKLLITVEVNATARLVRYLSDGKIDESYGINGYSEAIKAFQARAVQTADGRILVAGIKPGTGAGLFVGFYNDNGKLDVSFGVNGVKTVPTGALQSGVKAVVPLPNGNILLAGQFNFNNKLHGFVMRLLPDGTPDSSFATAGLLLVDVPGVTLVSSVIVDGTTIMVGATIENGSISDFAVIKYNGDGTPDLSFGANGIAKIDINTSDFLEELALQHDGKIIAAGHTGEVSWQRLNFTVVRLLSNGLLDYTFNGSGISSTTLGSANHVLSSVKIDADERIIVSGILQTYGRVFAFARFSSDGNLDQSFGYGGKRLIDIGSDGGDLHDGILSTDGSFVGVGFSYPYTVPNSTMDYLIVKLNANGQPEERFGVNGLSTGFVPAKQANIDQPKLFPDGRVLVRYSAFTNPIVQGVLCLNPDGTTDMNFGEQGFLETTAYQYEISPDQHIVSVESAYDNTTLTNKLIMSRYTKEGKPDLSFGSNGRKVLSLRPNSTVDGLTVQADGKLLLTGSYYVGWQQNGYMARLNEDGNVDKHFGADGEILFNSTHQELPRQPIIQPDGKIIVKGVYYTPDFKVHFFLRRFTSDGKMDKSFANQGTINSRFGIYSAAGSVLVQPDHKILISFVTISENQQYSLMLMRYNQDGTPDVTFGDKGITTVPDVAIALLKNRKILIATRITHQGEGDAALVLLNEDGYPDKSFGVNGTKVFKLSDGEDGFYDLVVKDNKAFATGRRYIDLDQEGILAGFLIQDKPTENISISSLTLVNAKSNKDVQELRNGEVIDLSSFPNAKLNIRANATSKVGSVVFQLKGPHAHTQTESLLPYALFGDDMKGRYYGSLLPVGDYTLTATPYSGAKGAGTKGTPVTIRFRVIYSATVSSFTLVNADTDKDLETLKDGDVLNLATLPSMKLNIRANTSPGVVGSVMFDLSGAQVRKHTENNGPYALFANNKSDYFAWTPQVGSYTLTAAPHSAASGSGEKGAATTIRFSVVYQPVQSFTLVNATTNKDIKELKEGDVIDLSKLKNMQLNIRANTGSARVGSVDFELQGPTTHKQTENLLPYALFGDNMKGRYYGRTPAAGNYTLTVTPYSAANKGGIKGQGSSIQFRIVEAQNACESPGFAPVVSTRSSVGGYQTSSADFNNDGKPDLAVLEYYAFHAGVLLGKGDGSFSEATPCTTGGRYPQALTAGDFNGDGNADLAIANENDYDFSKAGIVSILLGRGDGSFAEPVTHVTGLANTILLAADFNGDGKLDLALTNNVPGTVSILPGKGDGNFGMLMTYSSGGYFPRSMVLGDFNQDGTKDLAIGFDNAIGVLHGRKDGTFAEAVTYLSGGSLFAQLAVADINSDAKQDLVFTDYNSGEFGVLFGKGNGTFGEVVRYPTFSGMGVSSIAVDDFNGDDIPDIAAGNVHAKTVSLLLGKGNGSFAKPMDFPAGFRHGMLANDFNGDGKKDLAFSSMIYGVGVMLNTCSEIALSAIAKIEQKPLGAAIDNKAVSLLASPNPFSSQTTIRFSVPATRQTVLGVYNTSGLEVARLYQGKAEGGREYQVNFDGSKLAAGVYVLRLITEKETITTKVVIVR